MEMRLGDFHGQPEFLAKFEFSVLGRALRPDLCCSITGVSVARDRFVPEISERYASNIPANRADSPRSRPVTYPQRQSMAEIQ